MTASVLKKDPNTWKRTLFIRTKTQSENFRAMKVKILRPAEGRAARQKCDSAGVVPLCSSCVLCVMSLEVQTRFCGLGIIIFPWAQVWRPLSPCTRTIVSHRELPLENKNINIKKYLKKRSDHFLRRSCIKKIIIKNRLTNWAKL